MCVKSVIDEEKRRRIKYTILFVMIDNLTVLKSIQEYFKVNLANFNKDELDAHQHVHTRQTIYNVFISRSCFDQFLVNVQLVRDYASLVVGHTGLSAGKYLEMTKNIQTLTYVINVPDILDSKN